METKGIDKGITEGKVRLHGSQGQETMFDSDNLQARMVFLQLSSTNKIF